MKNPWVGIVVRFMLVGWAVVGFAFWSWAQSPVVEACGHLHATRWLFQTHPETRQQALADEATLEAFTRDFITQGVVGNRDELIIIPTVFHIVHDNGPENISDEQVLSAIEVANRDLRFLNPDADQIISEFTDITGDAFIELRLAQKDPQGNCHTGINRIQSPLTYVGDGDVKDLINWPRESYLNVWVVANAAGAAGYSLYPSSVANNQNAVNDGIVLAHNYTGNIGTSNNYRSRTLTHEVGHWINLRHTWGNSNSPGEADNCDQDDLVDDTPETRGWTSCTLDGESCGSIDNVQNYMEYSYCGRMFSQGQIDRMRAAMFSGVADRNELWTDENLEATGVSLEPILCVARFSSDRRTICAGDSVQFFDDSYHGVTEWSWQFSNGISAEGESPWVTFDLPGFYDVELTAGNGIESVSSLESNYLQVLPAGAMDLPFVDGFEAEMLDNSDWFHDDTFIDGDGWELTSAGSATGGQSMWIRNYSNDIEFNTDALITSTMDMSDAVEIHVNYKWAYAYRGTDEDEDDTDDRLKIYASGDCGASWNLRRMHRGYTDLQSAPPHPFMFIPNGIEEWNEYTLVLPYETYLTNKFRLKFEFESRLGNNIFLDDINITAVGSNDIAEAASSGQLDMRIYPNPVDASGPFALEFRTVLARELSAEVRDLTGRLIAQPMTASRRPAGLHKMQVSTAGWPAGLYLVMVDVDGIRTTRRLIVD
ncbi:MAG: M43 family zinc metalloprotease [Flavobacteriales bacterium]